MKQLWSEEEIQGMAGGGGGLYAHEIVLASSVYIVVVSATKTAYNGDDLAEIIFHDKGAIMYAENGFTEEFDPCYTLLTPILKDGVMAYFMQINGDQVNVATMPSTPIVSDNVVPITEA